MPVETLPPQACRDHTEFGGDFLPMRLLPVFPNLMSGTEVVGVRRFRSKDTARV